MNFIHKKYLIFSKPSDLLPRGIFLLFSLSHINFGLQTLNQSHPDLSRQANAFLDEAVTETEVDDVQKYITFFGPVEWKMGSQKSFYHSFLKSELLQIARVFFSPTFKTTIKFVVSNLLRIFHLDFWRKNIQLNVHLKKTIIHLVFFSLLI
jgi:hypothetical protein